MDGTTIITNILITIIKHFVLDFKTLGGDYSKIEAIVNIFDNPELLEEC